MRNRVIALLLLVGLQGLAGKALSDQSSVESMSFPVQRGDSLSITDDFGKILIRPSEGTARDIKARDDLRIQYQLGYNSTNRVHDGKWREIRVQVENHPDAVVRTRKGYYVRDDRAHATQ